jgi:molecular chaperone DnaK (HSP70)
MLDEVVGTDKVWGNVDPSTCVAAGAAMYSAYLDDRAFFHKEIEIRTRTIHALGVSMVGKRFREIVPANRPTPCKVKQVFTTTEDDLDSLDIDIYQGNGKTIDPATHTLIGTLRIERLPRRPAGHVDIEVEFRVDEEQRLLVSAAVGGNTSAATVTYA